MNENRLTAGQTESPGRVGCGGDCGSPLSPKNAYYWEMIVILVITICQIGKMSRKFEKILLSQTIAIGRESGAMFDERDC